MSSRQKTRLDWQIEENRMIAAGKLADHVIESVPGISRPIDPLAIVQSERPLLCAGGRHFGTRFDGKLEYNREKNCFLLFYNTRYDQIPGVHHPRTRFSIAHELAHYFIEKHHEYLMHVGGSHSSKGEFLSDKLVEKEADSFAASILLPTRFARPEINAAPLSSSRIRDISSRFDASMVATTFRSVQISDFPCAVAGIRDGNVNWIFPSKPLTRAGVYPKKGSLPANAQTLWNEFATGISRESKNEGRVRDWFNTYSADHLDQIYVGEEYIPVQTMNILLVLLTIDEADLFDHKYEE